MLNARFEHKYKQSFKTENEWEFTDKIKLGLSYVYLHSRQWISREQCWNEKNSELDFLGSVSIDGHRQGKTGENFISMPID